MDDQLEILEQTDDDQNVDSLYEPFEWISDADIDDLSNVVATFISTTEKSASSNVNSNDMEDVRKVVLQFRKLSTYFHHSQKGSNRLAKLQSDKKRPLEILNDCPTR
jgi:malate synthase